jgi:hypothetical protein
MICAHSSPCSPFRSKTSTRRLFFASAASAVLQQQELRLAPCFQQWTQHHTAAQLERTWTHKHTFKRTHTHVRIHERTLHTKGMHIDKNTRTSTRTSHQASQPRKRQKIKYAISARCTPQQARACTSSDSCRSKGYFLAA